MPPGPPALAEGVELIGVYEGSGLKDPPFIARRGDGQVVQIPELLYVVAEQIDGRRDHAEIAKAAGESFGRELGPGDAQLLIEEKLRPLGLIAGPNGDVPEEAQADPLLALRFKTAVVPERLTNALTTIFRPAYWPPVVVAVVLGMLALDVWLLGVHGISQGVRDLIYSPVLLVGLFGGVVLATAFHEIGHATACRYGGARPGAMGVGIYVIWPVFYTDVTDAYRLGKGARLRTDLGGVYFNSIFALATFGAYVLTDFEPLLLLILLQNFAILQQLLPLLRFDGYYIISDLTGVPDMFSRVKPVLRSLIPGRSADDQVEELKPWARYVVTCYVLVVVPLLALSVVLMVMHAPRAFATAFDSVGIQWDKVTGGDGFFDRTAGFLQAAALVLPCAGMVATSGRIGGRFGKAAWRWSGTSPVRRAALSGGTLAAVALVVAIWWPNGDYRPIQPGERGTIQGGVASLAEVPSGRPSLPPERERELGGAPDKRDLERRESDAGSEEREPVTREEREDPGTTDEPMLTTPTEPVPTTPAPVQPEQQAPAPAPEEPAPEQVTP